MRNRISKTLCSDELGELVNTLNQRGNTKRGLGGNTGFISEDVGGKVLTGHLGGRAQVSPGIIKMGWE